MTMRRTRSAQAGPVPTPANRPLLTVDVAILTLRQDALQVLLVRRSEPPHTGRWALPGGFIRPDDISLEGAARRVLLDKTGIETPYLEQLASYGDPRRDPRGWSATVAYVALISSDRIEPRHGRNADAAAWWPVVGASVAPNLAFDHARILADAVTRVRRKVEYTTLPVHLLPEKFTLPDLQGVYEQLLGRKLDKSAFRKRITEMDFLEPIEGERRPASNRPAQLWRVKPDHRTVFFERTI
jgi:ADP-ribose pyrophosphatase YjhB (NUDIX family)